MKAKSLADQWQEFKSEFPDNGNGVILIVKIGNFFEMFFEDAQIANEILSLPLTERQRIPMAGFPFWARDAYILKLVNAKYKVAVIDTVERETSIGSFQTVRKIIKIITNENELKEWDYKFQANYLKLLSKNT